MSPDSPTRPTEAELENPAVLIPAKPPLRGPVVPAVEPEAKKPGPRLFLFAWVSAPTNGETAGDRSRTLSKGPTTDRTRTSWVQGRREVSLIVGARPDARRTAPVRCSLAWVPVSVSAPAGK